MHFDSIQALRGLAAILVVLEHIRFLSCGAFGVDIFFCISGFMIMFTTYGSTEHFFLKRIIRIIPFYYAMTLVTYFLLLLFPDMFEQTRVNFSYLVKSLLFIPFDIGGGVIQPLLRIGWTVNYEMFFYLLFGISLRISHRCRGLICGGTIAMLVVLGRLIPTTLIPFRFYSDPVLLDFILGMLCYYAAEKLYHCYSAGGISNSLCRCAFLLAAAAVICLMITKPYTNILGFGRFLYWGIPAFFIVLLFFLWGLGAKVPAFAVKLGNMSFSVFLIHYYPILFLDRKVFYFESLTFTAVIGALLSIGLILLLSYIACLLIEKRLTGCLRRLLPR